MGLEVALEVEDLQLILLSEVEELAESSISLDVLLVHETLGLGVATDGGGNLAAAHESALGLTEEHTEIIGDLAGLGEDGLLLRLVGITLGLAVAATLAGLLELTGDALLELLHLGEDLGEGSTHLGNLLNEAVELGNDVDILNNSRGGSGDGRGGSNRGGSRSSNDRGRSGNRSSNSLLGVLLGGGGLAGSSLSGRAHLMSCP